MPKGSRSRKSLVITERPRPQSATKNGLPAEPRTSKTIEVGEKIDHVDGMTIEEAEHAMATRLYQNTAKVHFDAVPGGKRRASVAV